MSDDGGVAAKLAGAKKVLSGAQSFTKSVEGHSPSTFSNASYKLAHQASKSTEKPASKSTGENVAAGLEAKRKNIEEYSKASGQ